MNIGQLRQQFPFLREFTDEEVAGALIAAHGVTDPRDPRYAPLERQLLGYDRTTGEKLKDAGVGLVQGVLGLGETAGMIGAAAIPGVRAFDNPVVNTLRGWETGLDQYKSQGLRNQELGSEAAGDIAVRQATAQGAGFGGKLLAGAGAQAGEYIRNPGLAVQDTVQSIPSLVAGGVAGKAVQGGLRGVGLAANLATKGGVAAGISSSATLQGGDVAGDTYQRMRQAGADYETAANEAAVAGAKGGAASLALTAIPGGATIERSMIRGAGGRGGALGAVRGGAAEFASEAGEEGYGQYAGNQAVATVDPNVDLAQGVGRAAVQGGVGAFGPGVVAGSRHNVAAPAVQQPPRTETGEIDLTGAGNYAAYDTPAYVRRGLDPANERSSPYTPPAQIQDQERARALAAPSVPGYLQSEQDIPPFLRRQALGTDLVGPDVNPVQQTPANFADLYAEQTPNPYDTSRFATGPGTAPGAGPTVRQPAPQASVRTQAGATDFTTSPGAAPARGNSVEFNREVDTGNLSLQQPGQQPAVKPTMGSVLVALEKANAELGKNVIRKDGQVAQTAATAPLRQVLEAKDPVAKLQELYQDGKNTRDELLDVWHRNLTGQTIAEAKAQPQTNSAGFVPEPLPQLNAQLLAVREGRKPALVVGTEEAKKLDLTGLKTGQAVGPDGATAVVVSRDKKAVTTAVARAKEVGLKQAMGELLGVANPTLTSQQQAPAEGAATLQQVDNKTGQVIAEEVVTPADVQKVKQVPGTTPRLVPVDQPIAARVQQVAPQKETLAQRKISARVEGSSAAMDGEGRGANPYKPGTAAYREWIEGHDEVKARAEAAKENPVAKKLVEVVENTKDETLYDESLYALYKLAAKGDVVAFNYFHSNGYYDDISASGKKLKPAQAGEMKKLRERWASERGQQRGKAFGATKDVLNQIVEDDEGGSLGLRRRSVLVGLAGFLANIGNTNAQTTLGRAKPVGAEVLKAPLPPAVAKILRGNGATNPQGAKALREALQLMAATGPAELRQLTVNILKLTPKDGLLLTVDDKSLVNAHGSVELTPFAHLTLYTAEGRTGLTYGTMLHETLHAVVAARYRSLSNGLVRSNDRVLNMTAPQAAAAMEQFRKVWDEFNEAAFKDIMAATDRELKLSLRTALADPDEFFVRALTDPHLQAYMAKKEYKGKTLWERFKNWIKQGLFLWSKDTGQTPSWLNAALIASDELMGDMAKDPDDFKRLKAINVLQSKRSEKGDSHKHSAKGDDVRAATARAVQQWTEGINPKVRALVDAINDAGVYTELSGDMYGDDLVYVDVSVPFDQAQSMRLPRGWKVTRPFVAHTEVAHGLKKFPPDVLDDVIKDALARAHPDSLMGLGARGEITRLSRAGGKVSETEAKAVADALTAHLAAPGGDVLLSAMAEPTALKPLAEGARALTATLKAQLKGEEVNETLLNMLTLRQIDEQYGKKLPALRDWVNVVMQRSSNASKLAAEADRIALQWQQEVPRAEMKPLAEILLRASNAELQLDNTKPEYVNSLSEQERREYNELRSKLEALSPEAKQARTDALGVLKRQWDYTHQALTKFITLTVADPGLRQKRLDDLKQEFGRNHGDYFPLSRFGDRVVIARGAAKDGRDVVTFHESANSVDAEVRRLKDSGVKPDNIIVTMSTEYDPRKVPGSGFVRELHAMIDNIAGGEEAKQLHQTLQQLYLKSLPELSGAKHMVRRENIEGFSQDALRVFADAVTRGSRYASHLEFGPAVHAAMEAAEAQSRSSDRRSAAVVIGRKDGQDPLVKVVGTGTERLAAVEKMAEDGYAVEFFSAHPETVAERLAGALEKATPEEIAKYVLQVRAAVKKQTEGVEDLRAAKQLYNYMIRAQKADMDPNPSKLVELAGQVGYAWYLGFSPAFWAMNTLQNPMVGIPHLGGKYGVAKASTEWMRAAKWFATVRIGKRLSSDTEPFSVEWLRDQVKSGELKGINKNELDMLQRLEDRQVLDFTQAMDLSRIGAASSSSWYKAMRLAAAGAHHTEVFNRVSFALAAYRLAMKSRSDMTHEEATRAAERDVAAAHFDYSYANKPLWMGKSTPALRLVFMFQQYRQHMLYWWANTVKEATKGETPEVRTKARKAALLMGVSHLLFAGTMGLPFIGAVATLVNLLGGGGDDGEEPFDFERWIREAAIGMTGSEAAADLVTKGIFAALGADISKRIGQGDLLPLLNPGSARYERDFDDKTRAYLFDLVGPLGSIGLGISRAWEAFASGDYGRGLVAATPKAVSDILRAYQQSTEGLKDKRGQQLATEEAFDGWDAALQAAGITPTSAGNLRQARGAVLDIQHAFKDQSRRLTGAFIEAWMRSDAEGVKEALADIQRYNQNLAKGRFAQRELLITPDRIRSAIVDRQRRAMLLALTGGLADTRQQLLIATRVSGLYDLEGRDVRLDAAGLPALPSLGD